jgi:protein O-mannosyl-transferase
MKRRVLLAAAFLAVFTLAAYWRAGDAGFVNLDDDAYVEFAPMVNKGIRPAAVVWAFTAIHTSNWHPFTSLSHMLDCHLFGLKPGPMHWENVLFHVLNSVLVFLVWRAMSGAFWRPLIVAGLFALHPLHVESVAWISERKDVLSTLFWLLGIAAYLRWVRTRTAGRYILILAALATSLLFKPMAVTFPCTLLLIDAWPLRRLSWQTWRRLVWEKLPLFGVVAVHSVVTFVVQHTSGAANYAQRFTLDERIANAFVAYARYLGKTVWPERLAPLYHHPGSWPLLMVTAAVALFAAITFAAWRWRVTRPWFAFGWLWFAGTLVPVIGIVQVGAQAMADRYTYVPLLGIFTLVAWAGAEFAARFPRLRPALAAGAASALVAFTVLTWRQVGVWKDSITLHEHSIAVGEDNPGVRYLLAVALQAAGRPEAESVAQWQRAIELEPDYVNAHTQLALVAARHGRLEEAQRILEQNVQFEPRNPGLHLNLGVFAGLQGKPEDAARHYHQVLQLDPKNAGALRELAQLHARANRLEEARTLYDRLVRAHPWDTRALAELGVLSANLGRLADAQRYLSRAVWIDPENETNRRNLEAVEQLRLTAKS